MYRTSSHNYQSSKSCRVSHCHRTVHCGDSLTLLKDPSLSFAGSLIFSPPDIAEVFAQFNSILKYKTFFNQALELASHKLVKNDFLVAIFTPRYWTEDNKLHFIDKATWLISKASSLGFHLLQSKVVLNDNPTRKSTHYCNYSNLIIMQKQNNSYTNIPEFLTDVIDPQREKSWVKGFYLDVISDVMQFFVTNGVTSMFDPFCGTGSSLKAANDFGIDSVGIDIVEDYVEKARSH
ncbi:hypothetical protein P9112_011998 [Eukaryota sp. TZLM1-RC]